MTGILNKFACNDWNSQQNGVQYTSGYPDKIVKEEPHPGNPGTTSQEAPRSRNFGQDLTRSDPSPESGQNLTRSAPSPEIQNKPLENFVLLGWLLAPTTCADT